MKKQISTADFTVCTQAFNKKNNNSASNSKEIYVPVFGHLNT